jgi:hypothetical protein
MATDTENLKKALGGVATAAALAGLGYGAYKLWQSTRSTSLPTVVDPRLGGNVTDMPKLLTSTEIQSSDPETLLRLMHARADALWADPNVPRPVLLFSLSLVAFALVERMKQPNPDLGMLLHVAIMARDAVSKNDSPESTHHLSELTPIVQRLLEIVTEQLKQ